MFAMELFSETNSALFREYFPHDEQKQFAAKFCTIMKRGFKLLTTTGNESVTDFYNAPFGGEHLPQQKALLMEMLWFFQNLEDIGNCTFPRGAQMTIKGILKLQVILSENYGVESFPTANVTSDKLENFFGEMKCNKNGTNNDVTYLDWNYRASNYCTLKFLEDKNFNIFSLL